MVQGLADPQDPQHLSSEGFTVGKVVQDLLHPRVGSRLQDKCAVHRVWGCGFGLSVHRS